MKQKFSRVYQFKISLKGVKPRVWRRIQVPETYTFWDLHVAIQDAMGWYDYHLHEFELINPATGMGEKIGIPDESGWGEEVLSGWKELVADYFIKENTSASYLYDFGDCWEHDILLEKILPRNKEFGYPVCLDGKRACPPEDCGGPWGYKDFVEALGDPDHPEHQNFLEWIGGDFDPEHFEVKEVTFDDPEERWKRAFE